MPFIRATASSPNRPSSPRPAPKRGSPSSARARRRCACSATRYPRGPSRPVPACRRCRRRTHCLRIPPRRSPSFTRWASPACSRRAGAAAGAACGSSRPRMNSRPPFSPQGARRTLPSARTISTSSVSSAARVISRSRCWRMATAGLSTSSSAIVRCSGATRRSWSAPPLPSSARSSAMRSPGTRSPSRRKPTTSTRARWSSCTISTPAVFISSRSIRAFRWSTRSPSRSPASTWCGPRSGLPKAGPSGTRRRMPARRRTTSRCGATPCSAGSRPRTRSTASSPITAGSPPTGPPPGSAFASMAAPPTRARSSPAITILSWRRSPRGRRRARVRSTACAARSRSSGSGGSRPTSIFSSAS